MKHIRLYDLPILFVLVGGIVLALAAPDFFHGLMQEDAWAEWSTFLCFTGAAVLGVSLFVKATARLDKVAAVLLFAFAVFVAGEEISWGHRVLAFEPPEIFLEHNYQQEANLHNLLKNILDTRWMVAMIAVGYGVALPLLVRIEALKRFAPLAPSLYTAPGFVVIAVLEVSYPFSLTGELAELALSLCFVADLGERHQRLGGRPHAAIGVQVTSLVLSIGLTPVLESYIYGDQAENAALVGAELDLLAEDLKRDGALTKRMRKKRRVHKRVFTSLKKRYLVFDESSRFLEGDPKRRDRRGYFLDVWNQPYWLIYMKRDSVVVLYSFGANRRRDIDTKRPGEHVGDDVVRFVDLGL